MIPNVYPLPLIFIFVSKNNVICIYRYKYRAIYQKKQRAKESFNSKNTSESFQNNFWYYLILIFFPSLKVTLSLGTPQTIEAIATHTSAH